MMNKLPKLPDHLGIAPHFRNAASKAKYLAGELPQDEFNDHCRAVPLKRGLDNKTRKQLIANLKYARKVTSDDWQQKAEEIKKADSAAPATE